MSTAGFLAACEAEYADGKGERWALAQVIHACGVEGIPLPSWAAKAYSEGMEQTQRGERKWTEVLGGGLAKGQHADALAQRERLLWPAHRIFNQLCRPAKVPGKKLLKGDWDKYGAACDQLCRETGERISPTKLKDYVREAKRRLALINEFAVNR